jgi:hypothetical protein
MSDPAAELLLGAVGLGVVTGTLKASSDTDDDAASSAAAAAAGGDDGGGQPAAGTRAASLPTWWLIFLNVYNLPFGFGDGLISTITFLKVLDIAGRNDAEAFQGQVQLYVGLMMHVNMGIGWWSDLGFCGKRGVACGIGRRRPFIVIGHLMMAVSVGFFALADSIWTMVAFRVWHNLGSSFCAIPMSAIGPDQVPVHQRGTMVALGELINMTWGMTVGTAVGIYLGQRCSKNDAAGHAIAMSEDCPLTSIYILALGLNALCIPLGLMALGSRPGCCTPEIEISNEQTAPLPKGLTWFQRWCLAVQGLTKSFFEPFAFQPFRLWFISGFFTSISDIMWGQFQTFWFNDIIAPHTVFFGHHLTAIAAGEIGGKKALSFAASLFKNMNDDFNKIGSRQSQEKTYH